MQAARWAALDEHNALCRAHVKANAELARLREEREEMLRDWKEQHEGESLNLARVRKERDRLKPIVEVARAYLEFTPMMRSHPLGIKLNRAVREADDA